MVTAYDTPSARIVDRAGVDMVLVGDSLGMVMLGRKDTLSVTLDEMIHHCRAVVQGIHHALVVADMPFMTYEPGPDTALSNAARLVRESGVRAVKLEGAFLPQIRALVGAGIPVMGHIGLTPQRSAQLGGFKVQGKRAEAARQLLDEAAALEDAGCFAIVLEAIPAPLAAAITARVSVPTIGIGAGADCDGQVLVLHDMLGLYSEFTPRFVKRYAELGTLMEQAVRDYAEEVRSGAFPTPAHSFSMDKEERARLEDRLRETE
ncbi:3-methyl-2-oxobutanoate hydroxymethyltransferase [Bilophila wadsworthia]